MAFEIKVVNIKNPIPEGYWEVRIMRPFPLGNPFHLEDIHDDVQRAECITKYKTYLWEQMKNPGSLVLKTLITLAQTANDIALVCDCTAKPCPGDVVKAAVEYIRDNRKLIREK